MHQRKTTKIDEAKRKKLGETIAELRKKRFKRQVAFCKKFKEVIGEDLSPGTMFHYENHGSISERRLGLVAKVLGLTAEEEQQLDTVSKDAGLRYVVQHKQHSPSRKGTSVKRVQQEEVKNPGDVVPSRPELQELQNCIAEMHTLREFLDELIQKTQGAYERLQQGAV